MPPRCVGYQFFNVVRRYIPSRRVGSCTYVNGDEDDNDHDNEDICGRSDTTTKTRHGGCTRYARIFLLYQFNRCRMSPFNSHLQPTTTMKTAAAANANGDDES
jgi:hypothetical protein